MVNNLQCYLHNIVYVTRYKEYHYLCSIVHITTLYASGSHSFRPLNSQSKKLSYGKIFYLSLKTNLGPLGQTFRHSKLRTFIK
jgi:hypothetical protein